MTVTCMTIWQQHAIVCLYKLQSRSIVFPEKLSPPPAPAQIVIRPNQTTSVDAGNTIVGVCVAYGDPNPSITWNRGGTALSNDSRVTIYEELVTENGVTFVQSIIEVCSAEVSDAGQYSCFTENSFGNDTAVFELTVNAGGKAISAHVCQSSSY